MRLTRNFLLREFTASRTAKRLGIDNAPSDRQIDNLRRLCFSLLQPIRDRYDSPVIITSGYRCPELNEAVGGVADSFHTTGEAADFYVAGEPSAIHVFNTICAEKWKYDEAILYPDEHRLHVAVTGTNRQQQLVEEDGDYVDRETYF